MKYFLSVPHSIRQKIFTSDKRILHNQTWYAFSSSE